MTPRKSTHNALTKAEPRRLHAATGRAVALECPRPSPGGQGRVGHTFADWTLSGHGVVLRLPGGQEYWCTVAEAGY